MNCEKLPTSDCNHWRNYRSNCPKHDQKLFVWSLSIDFMRNRQRERNIIRGNVYVLFNVIDSIIPEQKEDNVINKLCMQPSPTPLSDWLVQSIEYHRILPYSLKRVGLNVKDKNVK